MHRVHTGQLQYNSSSKIHLSKLSAVRYKSEATFPTQSKAIVNRTSPRCFCGHLKGRRPLSVVAASPYKNKKDLSKHGARGRVALQNLLMQQKPEKTKVANIYTFNAQLCRQSSTFRPPTPSTAADWADVLSRFS